MKIHKKSTYKGHILDTEREHTHDSYQSVPRRQNLRQDDKRNTHNFKREDLGFTHRDTRGYDKTHKGKY
ncbi:MAG: hypothetical protein ACXVCY_16720 [Pseudobdellovibrionaceae bacterium]